MSPIVGVRNGLTHRLFGNPQNMNIKPANVLKHRQDCKRKFYFVAPDLAADLEPSVVFAGSVEDPEAAAATLAASAAAFFSAAATCFFRIISASLELRHRDDHSMNSCSNAARPNVQNERQRQSAKGHI
jgi:hypothetical protein